MLAIRSFTFFWLAAGLLVLALPAAAGTLAPQLRTLVESWRQAPALTITRAAQATAQAATAARVPRLLAAHVHASGKVQVYLHYRRGEMPSERALVSLGASGILVSRALGVIQAWIPIAELDKVATVAGISRVNLPVYAFTKGLSRRTNADSCVAVPTALAINQEAIEAENTAALVAAGITGQGVKIGILSNGVDCRSVSQAAGYLPANIFIPAGLAGEGDEGTAMLELVHAMAPGATLGFCSGTTSVNFLQCLDDFASWGANVIADDLGYFPFGYHFSVFTNDNTGGNAIAEFANAHRSISLVTSAGNDQEDYYEADYAADTAPSSPGLGDISLAPAYTVPNRDLFTQYAASNRRYISAMDFAAAIGQGNDAAVQVTIGGGNRLFANLTWNDPAAGPYDDLDLFLLKSDGSVACAPTDDGSQWCASTLDQLTFGSQGLWPIEFLSYTNHTDSDQTLYLVALCYDCSAHGTQALHIKLYGFMNGGGQFNYTTHGGIAGHATLKVETTTAAARVLPSGAIQMEPYSDVGPFTYGDWTQPPKVRRKPDITGIDGVRISGAGDFGTHGYFYGTSASAPNVGAVIVLLRGAYPSAAANAEGWKQILLDTASAQAIVDYSLNASGAGLVDAAAAASAVAVSPSPNPEPQPSPDEGGGGALSVLAIGMLGALLSLALRRKR